MDVPINCRIKEVRVIGREPELKVHDDASDAIALAILLQKSRECTLRGCV